MTRRRFIADKWEIEDGRLARATLVGDQAEHLARVLRAEPGQVFDVVANGFLHRAEVATVQQGGGGSKTKVQFVLHEELESEAALPVHLLLAIFRFDPMEWAIEKATELGVAKITPVLARRTDKHLAMAAPKRVERWRKIVFEAAKQSRRTDVPEIATPMALAAALETETVPLRILLSEVEQEVSLADVLRSAREDAMALAIGPEGGWTADEMELFAANGWRGVTLGPRILRAETAAVAALAITGAVR